jgi:hypothetical protein
MTRRLALLWVALTLACGERAPAPEPVTPVEPTPTTVDSLPWAQRIRLEQATAEHDARYAPIADEAGFTLRSGGIAASVTIGGASVALGHSRVNLALASIGRGSPSPVTSTAVAIDGPRAAIDRGTIDGGTVREWWRALPSGLEHGFDLAARPAGEGELRLSLAVTGASLAAQTADAIELRDAAGVTLLGTYAHLVVLDATGATVPATMRTDGGSITIAIDDRDARYPLAIDPALVATQEVEWPGLTTSISSMGQSVALDSTGTRALVSGDNQVYVYLRNGTGWAQEAVLHINSVAVALDATGTRALLGGSGAAYVFVRSGSSWTQEAQLPATGLVSGDGFGSAVALDSTGTRAVVGAPQRSSSTGVVYVFFRSGTTWSQEAQLQEAAGAANDLFGASVAVDSNATRLLVGAEYANSLAGAAYVFLRSGTSWAQEAQLSPTGLSNHTGSAVALDSTGTRALVVSYGFGLTYVFVRGASWAQEAVLSTPQDASGNSTYAVTVAVDSTGAHALVGCLTSEAVSWPGTAFIFTRGASWDPNPAPLAASDSSAGDYFGSAVALDGTAARALVGAYQANSFQGAAYVFTFRSADPNGTPCSDGSTCLSSNCIEGVCCDTTCDYGAVCGSCLSTRTGMTTGTCAPLTPALASSVTCRAASGACQLAAHCTSSSTTCPANVLLPANLVCRASSGACDQIERCNGTSAMCPSDVFVPAGTVCRAANGMCDLTETCTGSSDACPADVYVAAGTVCRAATPGAGCDVAETCTGSSDACPADVALPAGTVCRPARTDCDQTEVCNGTNDACPTDMPAAAGTVCRASSAPCDATERCTGTSYVCPPDVVMPATTMCHAASGPCDTSAFCDGFSDACPPSFQPVTVMCRAASGGGCDQAAFCNGASAMCPLNPISAAGTHCGGGTGGSCSSSGTCDGSTATCRGGMPLPVGTQCAMPSATNPCDLGGTCDGTSLLCQMQFAAASVVCHASSGGACDSTVHCPGNGPTCPSPYLSGVVCRRAAGGCDIAESCTGADANCPHDAVEGAGTVCRASTAMCDPAESCDGMSTMCPADVNMCMQMPDTGVRDAGADTGARDGGPSMNDAAASGIDAGGPPPPINGACGCASVPSRGATSIAGVAFALVVLAGRRRRARIRAMALGGWTAAGSYRR